jgi:hypothetical protein
VEKTLEAEIYDLILCCIKGDNQHMASVLRDCLKRIELLEETKLELRREIRQLSLSRNPIE